METGKAFMPKFKLGDSVVFYDVESGSIKDGIIVNYKRDSNIRAWVYDIMIGPNKGPNTYVWNVNEEYITTKEDAAFIVNVNKMINDLLYDPDISSLEEIEDIVNESLFKKKLEEERKMAEEKKLTIRGKVYRKDIKQVIFQAPATIILFEDGTKSVVKVNGDDMYNKQIGFLLALCKGCFDSKSYDVILRLIDDFNDQENKKEIKLKTYLNLPPKSSNYAGKINSISFKYDITFEDVRNVFKNKVPASKDNEVSIAKNAYHIGVAKRLCEMILESGDAHVATDICAAVEHLMVCLEERSHNLNYEKSFEFHNIKLLMERYHFDEKRPSETKSESQFDIGDIVKAKKGHGTKYRIIEKKRLPDDTWTYVARTLGICGSRGHINRHFREDQLTED